LNKTIVKYDRHFHKPVIKPNVNNEVFNLHDNWITLTNNLSYSLGEFMISTSFLTS